MGELKIEEVVYTGLQELQKRITDSAPVKIFEKIVILPIVEIQVSSLLREGVRLSPKSLGEIYEHTKNFSALVGIDVPQVFVVNNRAINAYSLGYEGNSFIVLNSGIIDSLSNEEIKAVIGHEIGHIVCSHSATSFISNMEQFIPGRNLIPGVVATLTMNLLIKKWSRAMEITADRFSIISCESLDTSEMALAKLMLGVSIARKLDFNIDELLEQNEEIRNNWFYKLRERCDYLFSTHPTLLKRILALRLFGRYWFDRKLTKHEIDNKVSALISGELAHALITHDESYESVLTSSIAFLAKSSSGISKLERNKIMAIAKEYKFSKSLYKNLIYLLDDPSVDIKSIPKVELSLAQKEDILEKLFDVATSDSEYDELEDDAILLISDRLEIPEELVDSGRLDAAQKKGNRTLLQKWMTASRALQNTRR